jgi:mono/diheme cytochrome c family protein
MDERAFDRVFALYRPDTPLEPVLDALRRQGVEENAVEILTDVPWRADSSAYWGRIPVYVWTMIAGLLGIAVGLFFAAGTAALFPIMTGGKPIVAIPVVGIISYETMMLVAVVVTFLILVVRIKTIGRSAAPYDARIGDGYIGVLVRVPKGDSRYDAIKSLLAEEGKVDSTGRGIGAKAVALVHCLLVVAVVGGQSACSEDMKDQASYQPQEAPRRHSAPQSVPRPSGAVHPGAAADLQTDTSERGRLFQINCSHCHGQDGSGNGPVASFLAKRPDNLQSDQVQARSDTELYDIITHGHETMPAFRGLLSADERRAIARNLKLSPRQMADDERAGDPGRM